MAFEFDRIWRTFRTRGPKIALLGLGSAVGFLIINKLFDNAVTSGLDQVWSRINPPTFVIAFTKKVNVTEWTLLKEDSKTKVDAHFKPLGPKAIEVTVVPGIYLLQLRQNDPDGPRILTTQLTLLSPIVSQQVVTSEDEWETEFKTTHYEEVNLDAPANLVGTRWTTTSLDWEVARSISDHTLQNILFTALGQVGVNVEVNHQRIEEYWSTTGYKDRPHQFQWWGGVFLAWVLLQSNLSAPAESASFKSWVSSGETVPIDQGEPGMLVVLDYPQTPSKLLVGVLLRKGKACTEVIVGNIVDRVVITCAVAPLRTIRRPI